MVLRCDSLDTVSIGELKYTRKRFFFLKYEEQYNEVLTVCPFRGQEILLHLSGSF